MDSTISHVGSTTGSSTTGGVTGEDKEQNMYSQETESQDNRLIYDFRGAIE